MLAEFDYIVVGAGSAGAVLANRLSADPKNRVLCMEAGTKHGNSLWVQVPIGNTFTLQDKAYDWDYAVEPHANNGFRTLKQARGKMLGGSSGINGLIYVRGQPQDFDRWAQLGCTGWSFDDVAPVFKRMEGYQEDGAPERGHDGPLKITQTKDTPPLLDVMFQGANAAGYAFNPDYNGMDQEGFSTTQQTVYRGKRQSTDIAYLRPARRRSNLTVASGATVEKLLFEGKRCVGVRYRQNGQVQEVRSGREVIVASGAIGSPHILQLSGIGRADLISAQGIEVVQDLHGVGGNLQDHYNMPVAFEIHPGVKTASDSAHGFNLMITGLQYVLQRRGLLGNCFVPFSGFFKSRPDLETPDVQLLGSAGLIRKTKSGHREFDKRPGFRFASFFTRPESTGHVHIQSPDPKIQPEIVLNYLDTEYDRMASVAAIRIARKIGRSGPLGDMVKAELLPGDQVQTDDEILQFIRETALSGHHPVGSCKMGIDPMAVVDPRLKVRGVVGLRVADASIMPRIVSGNTNATSIMIGEKCAEMVLEDKAA